MKKIAIGIQARTNSERLPEKVLMDLSGRTLLEQVHNECKNAADYINRSRHLDAHVKVYVLIPENDYKIKERHPNFIYLEGSEKDVLSRYLQLANETQADYIVRITADCGSITSAVISRHIKTAIISTADYITNTIVRTFMEGLDVEVMSLSTLLWLKKNAISDADKEHVTTAFKDYLINNSDKKPDNLHIVHILDKRDLSHINTSIDTPEDMLREINERKKVRNKITQALRSGSYVI